MHRYVIPTTKMPRSLISLRWGFRELEKSNPLSRRIEDLL